MEDGSIFFFFFFVVSSSFVVVVVKSLGSRSVEKMDQLQTIVPSLVELRWGRLGRAQVHTTPS